MSAAYHHFGMVSPFKVARDAASSSSNGASKFYDEFATWRELSYAACLRMWPHLETMQVLASAMCSILLCWSFCLGAGLMFWSGLPGDYAGQYCGMLRVLLPCQGHLEKVVIRLFLQASGRLS